MVAATLAIGMLAAVNPAPAEAATVDNGYNQQFRSADPDAGDARLINRARATGATSW
ncbi:hypothetical protein [Streptomyces sp. B1I3]|uniref:hypothetical protein n=1 Tax=Streptomyces sp. B1I3 TaxID=3042264 RepID=UPI002783B4A2|nr:hypothetical protein [Streptomyces sp. B1I3]MDQ0792660.1 hypothetical protein [Streptomyces sp. B1I3]